MDAIERLTAQFIEIYGKSKEEISIFFSPGRVNLIGEHTDTNGGFVFPCALDLGTWGLARINRKNEMRFASMNFDLKVAAALDRMVFKKEDGWANYLKGMVYEIQAQGFHTEGLDILLEGNLPNGAGLSSSASIEVLMGVILQELFSLPLSRIDIVQMAQRCENHFIGLQSGIMDQYAVGFGKEGYALFLDCAELGHRYVPVALGAYRIVIANSNKKRELTGSSYNERRADCQAALKDLQKQLPIQNLCELTVSQWQAYQKFVQKPLAKKRANHAITENERVKQAVRLLESKDLAGFGRLLNDSHLSLRNDYEVTCFETDVLAEEAWKQEGVLGSRMTGAGFGGCTVSIVHESWIHNFIETVGKRYKEKTGLTADFYVAEVKDGTKRIR